VDFVERAIDAGGEASMSEIALNKNGGLFGR
jgi:hypothetical protein